MFSLPGKVALYNSPVYCIGWRREFPERNTSRKEKTAHIYQAGLHFISCNQF